MAKNTSHHCFITSVRISNISFHQNESTGTETTYKIILAPCAKIYTYTPDKDKGVAAHTMKAYVGMEVWFRSFLDLMLSVREWSASQPDCFTYGKRAPDPLNKGMDEPCTWVGHFGQKAPDPLQKGMDEPCNWVGHFGQKINLLAQPGINQFQGRPPGSLITILTMLSWHQCHNTPK